MCWRPCKKELSSGVSRVGRTRLTPRLCWAGAERRRPRGRAPRRVAPPSIASSSTLAGESCCVGPNAHASGKADRGSAGCWNPPNPGESSPSVHSSADRPPGTLS
eukprot:8795979-Pyramimonas_sp.AAC.1